MSSTTIVLKGARKNVTNRPSSFLQRGLERALLLLRESESPLGEGPQNDYTEFRIIFAFPQYIHTHTLNPGFFSHSALLE